MGAEVDQYPAARVLAVEARCGRRRPIICIPLEETKRADRPENPTFQESLDGLAGGQKTAEMADRQQPAVPLGRGDHLIAFGR